MDNQNQRLVICLKNEGYEASLEARKVYLALADADAAHCGRIRVIDESGEDYLYPAEFFVDAELPRAARSAVMAVMAPR